MTQDSSRKRVFRSVIEIGAYDAVSVPLNTLGIIDSARLAEVLGDLFRRGGTGFVLDLRGIETLYSDTLNLLGQVKKEAEQKNIHFHYWINNEKVVKLLRGSGLSQGSQFFKTEQEIIEASLFEPLEADLPKTESSVETLQASSQTLSESLIAQTIEPPEDEEEIIAIDKGKRSTPSIGESVFRPATPLELDPMPMAQETRTPFAFKNRFYSDNWIAFVGIIFMMIMGAVIGILMLRLK